MTCVTCSSARMPCQGLCGPSRNPAHGSPAITVVFEASNKDIHFSCLWCQKRESHMYCLVQPKQGQQDEQDRAGCCAATAQPPIACGAVCIVLPHHSTLPSPAPVLGCLLTTGPCSSLPDFFLSHSGVDWGASLQAP